jgi:hypothetical protein
MKGRPFSAALYSRTYNSMKKLITTVNTDKYHAHKLKTCREEWAQGGRHVFFTHLLVSVTDLPPNSLQQKSDDDFKDHVGFRVRLD